MRKKIIKALKRISEIITAFLAFAFVILGTSLVYFYAKGYRFNPDGGDVRETGVINVESTPSRADIYIQDIEKGKTPRTIASIDEGFANVILKKAGYHDWKKNVPIFREKSSSVTADLFLKEIREEKITDIPSEISNLLVSENNLHFIYTIKENKNTISIWKYDLLRNFWDLSNNPHLVATLTITNDKSFKIYSSPDARHILVQYEYLGTNKKTILKSTLFNTDQIDSKGTDIDLTKFNTSYNISWSNSEAYIMLESNSDIISLNISTKSRYLIYKKASKEKLIWSTDSENNMYYLSSDSDDSGSYQTLEQISLDGTNSKTLIPRIYSQSSDSYIESLKTQILDYIPFSNSPISTKFVGKIDSFYIDQTTKGIFISTEKASYWYETENDKYILIHPAPAEVISVSEDKEAILFKEKDKNNYYVFTFDKEKNDPVAQIGSKSIITTDNIVERVQWTDEDHLLYSSESKIYILDKDGDNRIEINPESSPLLYSAPSSKYLHTIELINQKIQINKYTLQ